ncbi:hypothetical protein DFH07DRAFT_40086 [Mycena maculata]|uniref:Secreted protein n=1 Tax=Mycena maculata TaxID=230809 RepID=A0AAD7IG81_9AGAR|nr:hypothetical protein DFH07DRAFT_40086 [Mycena maculata]
MGPSTHPAVDSVRLSPLRFLFLLALPSSSWSSLTPHLPHSSPSKSLLPTLSLGPCRRYLSFPTPFSLLTSLTSRLRELTPFYISPFLTIDLDVFHFSRSVPLQDLSLLLVCRFFSLANLSLSHSNFPFPP